MLWAYTSRSKLFQAPQVGDVLTIGNIGDLTKDVVSADLFVTLWWADQRLADHGDIDFGTDTPVCGLEVKQTNKVNSNNPQAATNLTVANFESVSWPMKPCLTICNYFLISSQYIDA